MSNIVKLATAAAAPVRMEIGASMARSCREQLALLQSLSGAD